MIRFRRRNTLWLVMMGLLVSLALLSETMMPLALQAFLIISYLAAFAASSLEAGSAGQTILDSLRLLAVRNQITADGREAAERAKARGGFPNPRLTVLDGGLIAAQVGAGEMNMRRAKSFSKDDDGVQPFIILHVQKPEAGRNVIVRFEIEDHNGDRIFIHSTRTFLREGEMNILSDHQLRLSGNDEVQGAGDWELRVYIDDQLTAIQPLILAPSITERNRRLAGDARPSSRPQRSSFDIIDEIPEERPARLQDLLEKPVNPDRRSIGTARRTRSQGFGDVE